MNESHSYCCTVISCSFVIYNEHNVKVCGRMACTLLDRSDTLVCGMCVAVGVYTGTSHGRDISQVRPSQCSHTWHAGHPQSRSPG